MIFYYNFHSFLIFYKYSLRNFSNIKHHIYMISRFTSVKKFWFYLKGCSGSLGTVAGSTRTEWTTIPPLSAKADPGRYTEVRLSMQGWKPCWWNSPASNWSSCREKVSSSWIPNKRKSLALKRTLCREE